MQKNPFSNYVIAIVDITITLNTWSEVALPTGFTESNTIILGGNITLGSNIRAFPLVDNTSSTQAIRVRGTSVGIYTDNADFNGEHASIALLRRD